MSTRGRSAIDRSRVSAERSWQRFTEGAVPDGVRPAVLRSWQRSRHLPLSLGQAPFAGDAPARWRDSVAGRAVEAVSGELKAAAVDGDFVAAITDADGTIVWSAGGRTMRTRAEQVAFVPGGRWGEQAVGTNALGLALQEGRPTTVWSAEHYSPIVHDWVCYSAPVHDPATGRVAGVVDLSTTWQRATPLALTTVTVMARLFDQAMGTAYGGGGQLLLDAAGPLTGGRVDRAAAGLRMRLLGPAAVEVGGAPCALPPRQLDLVAVLALAPGGLSLDALHERLHGDRPVATSTTKAEVSHLRKALGPQVASRPYRFVGPGGRRPRRRPRRPTGWAAGGGPRPLSRPLLPLSEAPAVVEHRHLIDAALRNAVIADGEPLAVARLAELMPDDPFLQERLLASLPARDARRALAQARLDALG